VPFTLSTFSQAPMECWMRTFRSWMVRASLARRISQVSATTSIATPWRTSPCSGSEICRPVVLNQLVDDTGAVVLGGVDVGDAKFDRHAQHRDRFVPIPRKTEHPIAC
jgi:hypothetical protein